MFKDIIKPALILFIICVVVTAALSFTYNATKETIDLQAFEKALHARSQVLPGAGEFKEIDLQLYPELLENKKIEEIFEGTKDNNTIGYVISIIVQGYGDKMVVVAGIDSDGTLISANVREHSETPGLGSKVAEQPFLSQLNGINKEDNIRVVKTKVGTHREEINAVTGATISSNAVVGAVKEAIAVFEILKEEAAQQ